MANSPVPDQDEQISYGWFPKSTAVSQWVTTWEVNPGVVIPISVNILTDVSKDYRGKLVGNDSGRQSSGCDPHLGQYSNDV